MFKLFVMFLFDLSFCILLWLFLDSLYHLTKLKKYKSMYSPISTEHFLYKFFIRFPELLAEFINDCRSDDFKEHGLYLFCGEQGSGKTYKKLI